MKTNRIFIRPDRLNAPLAKCRVGCLSSAVFTLCGDIPDDITGIGVEIERLPDAEGNPRSNFVVAGKRNDDGTWRCYISPFNFPDVADGLKYHVIGTDDGDGTLTENPRWLGTGSLEILANPSDGSAVVPPLVPPDTYIRNPSTGLYHKVLATVDEYGNITLNVEEEGVEK